jgi:predicted transcriptional regulator
MPVIYTATIPIRVNGDGTIDILSKLKEEVRKCGCIDIAVASRQFNTSLETARSAAKQLAGDGAIACDNDGLYCCTDEGRLTGFMDAMKRLRRD